MTLVLLLPMLVNSKTPEVNVTLHNHLFYPAVIIIPSDQKVKLVIENKDDTPEEFDSFDLNREKVIFPHKKATIFISPLSVGDYSFFGEYNPNSAKGIIRVVDANKPQKSSTSGDENVN